jgi:hypothetical protein
MGPPIVQHVRLFHKCPPPPHTHLPTSTSTSTHTHTHTHTLQLPELCELDLAYTGVRDSALWQLEGLSTLTSLNLDSCTISDK